MQKTIEQVLVQGYKYLEDHQWEKAKQQFGHVISRFPDNRDAHRGVGLATWGIRQDKMGNVGTTNTIDSNLDEALLCEAFESLSEAYRLGARDADTIRTLDRLYGAFRTDRERIGFLEDVARTADDSKIALEASSIIVAILENKEMFIEAVERHRAIMSTLSEAAPEHKIESYLNQCVANAYREAGYIDEWLRQTEYLLSRLSDDAVSRKTHLRYYQTAGYHIYILSGQFQKAVSMGYERLHLLQGEEENPYRRFCINDTYAFLLLRGYYGLGNQKKVTEILTAAEENLLEYEQEWCEVLEATSAKSVGYKASQDAMYRRYIGGSYHNLGWNCRRIGEGNLAIRFFGRALEFMPKSGLANMYMAALMLGVKNNREASLIYMRRAIQDRLFALDDAEHLFLDAHEFSPVRKDPEFLALIPQQSNSCC